MYRYSGLIVLGGPTSSPPPILAPSKFTRSIVAFVIFDPVSMVLLPEKFASFRFTFGPTRYPPDTLVDNILYPEGKLAGIPVAIRPDRV